MLPVMEDDIFAPDPFIVRVTEGSGNNTGKSKGTSHTSTTIEGHSVMDAESYSRSSSQSHAASESRSQGTSATTGHSEALESVFENLPTAVHSLQNEQYRAGLMLRSLPTAIGYLSFVGSHGAVATLFKVPPGRTQENVPFSFLALHQQGLSLLIVPHNQRTSLSSYLG